jgi:hypothetical protein
MTLPNYIPDEETLKKRREPKFIIDPKDVVLTDEMRVRKWSLEIMQKHSSRFNDQIPNLQIVFAKEVEPEEIDIRNIYPFDDLYYIIFKKDPYWCHRILYKTKSGNHSILAEIAYAHIDGV